MKRRCLRNGPARGERLSAEFALSFSKVMAKPGVEDPELLLETRRPQDGDAFGARRIAQPEVERLGVLREIARSGLYELHRAPARVFDLNRGADGIAI